MVKFGTRSFFDASQGEDMQLQVYSLLARYIEEAGFYIKDNDPYELFKMIQIIYPCIHTRLPAKESAEIKKKLYELRDVLFGVEHTQEELTVFMDELYELYLRLQEVLQKEGITLRVRTDPGSIVAR